MAPPSILAWRIPGTEEPGGLLSMGSHRVGHDWSDLTCNRFEFYLFASRIIHYEKFTLKSYKKTVSIWRFTTAFKNKAKTTKKFSIMGTAE